jgi:UDP:flavonoid glycosyltransferase YjiC (YdhE family)
MRVAIVCNDSRGGIQPYAALAQGLRQAGHEVRVVAPADVEPLFAAAGLPFAPLSGSPEAALRATAGRATGGSIASMRFVIRELSARINTWTRETLQACQGVDVVSGGIGGMVVGLSVAEKLGVPFVESHLQPVGAPTGAYPGVLLAGMPRWLGSPGRRLSHHLSEMALWLPFRPAMRSARRQVLGLAGRPRAAEGQPVLYGFSRHVVPVPPSATRARHVTGYWTLPPASAWRPSPALDNFLARDGPVVSVGFGSMASADAGGVTALVLDAIQRAGVRAVLLGGWGGLSSPPQRDDVFYVDAVPHDWLFPRVSAAVHHGGAGTTGASLRAGIPAVVVPFIMDQPFWASRVAALGAGPAPIPRRRLTVARLAGALRQAVADEATRSRASGLGASIRAEDGVAEAVGHFGRLARPPAAARSR